MTKTQQISAMILSKIAGGMSTKEAINTVLGAGAFEKLAGEVYEELRARG